MGKTEKHYELRMAIRELMKRSGADVYELLSMLTLLVGEQITSNFKPSADASIVGEIATHVKRLRADFEEHMASRGHVIR